MRILKCVGATLLMLIATFVGFSACYEAGARHGHEWGAFRLDRLLAGRALLYSLGTPLFLLGAVLTAKTQGASPALAAGGIASAIVATPIGIYGTLIANKDPSGLPFMAVATILFVASTLMLSSRTNPRDFAG